MQIKVQNNVTELLIDSAALMLVGMIFVFIFLGLMIGSVKLIALFCQKFPGSMDAEQQHHFRQTPSNPVDEQISPATIAAISAAVHQYRSSH